MFYARKSVYFALYWSGTYYLLSTPYMRHIFLIIKAIKRNDDDD